MYVFTIDNEATVGRDYELEWSWTTSAPPPPFARTLVSPLSTRLPGSTCSTRGSPIHFMIHLGPVMFDSIRFFISQFCSLAPGCRPALSAQQCINH